MQDSTFVRHKYYFCYNTYMGLINIFIIIIYPARIQNPFQMFSKASISSAQLKTKEPNTCMRSPYPARMTFNITFRCTHLWFSLMWNFRFSARTIRHILYIRGRECVRPRSTTTDHLSPTALAHTAPPRHSRPVTANRPPSPPTPPSSPPPSPYALRLKNYERRHLRMYVHLFTTR